MGKKNSRKKGAPVAEKSPPMIPSPVARTVFDFNNPRLVLFVSLLLFGLVASVFLPTVRGDFIQFDDGEYVTQNTHVNTGLTLENIVWSLRSLEDCNWHPLTWWSHMMDCQLYGLKPAGHHLTNVLIHGLNTVLVFLLLRKLTGANWRSLIVALLFGLHPLRVESVAWISERKDVLCVMFSLLTFWTYAKYVELSKTGNSKSKLYYGLALASFSCALMSKPMAVTVPCILLLLDYWPLGRWEQTGLRKLMIEKLPFFLLTAIASVITCIAQKEGGVMSELGILPFDQRFENALISYARYLGKLFWPEHLCALYPYPEQWPLNEILFAGLLLIGVSVFTFTQRRQRPYLLIGWLWFLGALVPVIGLFVQAGPQSMADRYSYLPCIGILIAVVWGFHEISKSWRFQAAIASLVVCAVVTAFILLTVIQISYWKDGVTVWKRAVELTQNNFAAHMRLGLALSTEHRFVEGLREFQEAVRIKPGDPNANWLLAREFHAQRLLDKAIVYYQKTSELDPTFARAQFNLGLAYYQNGQLDEAIVHLQKGLEIEPTNAGGQNDLGVAFFKKGEMDEAIVHLQKAVEYEPTNVNAHSTLALIFFQKGQLDEAIAHFQAVAKYEPSGSAECNLGSAYYQNGQLDEALVHFQKAEKYKPNDPVIEDDMGAAFLKKGQFDDAIGKFQEALRLSPDFAEARAGLNSALKLKAQTMTSTNQPAK